MSAVGVKHFWYERGRNYPAPWWWVRFGPVVVEIHGDRWGCGIVASRWYVGALIGPVVVTAGSRKWVLKEKWSWQKHTVTFELDEVPAAKS